MRRSLISYAGENRRLVQGGWSSGCALAAQHRGDLRSPVQASMNLRSLRQASGLLR
jgi:hypothetical protein